jgi:serine/threonine protein kinase
MHRDLKPENILMKRKKDVGSVKVTDFGFTKEGGRAESFLGTVGYLAPEITEGNPYVEKGKTRCRLLYMFRRCSEICHSGNFGP